MSEKVADWRFVGQLWVAKKCQIGEPVVRWIFNNVSRICNEIVQKSKMICEEI